MKMIKITGDSFLGEIKSLYERAFPPSEKKPFALILKKRDTGEMEIYAIVGDSGEFLGLAIFILEGRLALLDYLAIEEDKRGSGVGSAVIREIGRMFPEKVLLLEIEDPEENDADNTAERVRRFGFYTRLGLRPMPYKVWLFGVKMLIMTLGASVDFDEYHRVFINVFSKKTAKNVKLA